MPTAALVNPTNPAASYAVIVVGMANINVSGNAAGIADFFDAPGSGTADTFYAYADNNGQSLAGMYGSYGGQSYSNSASGFGTNVGYATKNSDTAVFFDSPEINTFYAYPDYNLSGQNVAGMLGTLANGYYSNAASGFGTSFADSINGGSDIAAFFDSPGTNTFSAHADYNGKPLASMSGSYGNGSTYTNSAIGFSNNFAHAINKGSDTAQFYDSPGNDTFYAYADYLNGGQPLAGMYGSYTGFGNYSNAASGFSASIGYSNNGGSDGTCFSTRRAATRFPPTRITRPAASPWR